MSHLLLVKGIDKKHYQCAYGQVSEQCHADGNAEKACDYYCKACTHQGDN